VIRPPREFNGGHSVALRSQPAANPRAASVEAHSRVPDLLGAGSARGCRSAAHPSVLTQTANPRRPPRRGPCSTVPAGIHGNDRGGLTNKFVRSTVCQICLVAGIAAVAVTGCGARPAPVTVHDAAPSSRVQAAPTAPASATSPVAAPPVAAPPVEAQSWVMPDLSGQNLQAAQDAIQALTGNPGFLSTSTDLTGQARMQVMDRNWQVCSSTPAPGEAFNSASTVDFGVVKLDSESCP
jgi:hypothetical protein